MNVYMDIEARIVKVSKLDVFPQILKAFKNPLVIILCNRNLYQFDSVVVVVVVFCRGD